ncbi:preprotein translocase subunit SecE [uncultured Pseudoteredinibacter sp.]|uniref:preprotein translocase subunit SecE n=1 Tax=uncultured Pseudoteredinibacter sp. TaxID=1641701 RepID=UPI00260A4601|nr:preprotein translocase subunit SecE [uncultured Pseudoteredinibacter sp.]
MSANAKAEPVEFRFDALKWLVVVALVAAGVVGNSYFAEQALLYRVLGLVALAAAALFVAVNTAKGNAFYTLLQESLVEVRKVVWPSRQETNQTTLIVVAVVIIMGILLWLLDTFLGWLASLIIG